MDTSHVIEVGDGSVRVATCHYMKWFVFLSAAFIPVLLACSSRSRTFSGTTFCLLADSRLIAVRIADGHVIAEQKLAQGPVSGVGRLMVVSKKANSLVVLVANRLFVMELPSLRITKSISPTRTDCTFRGIAIGPMSNRLYVFGNCGDSVNVTVFDPSATRELENWSGTLPAKLDWMIYQADVSADERRVFISYHGSNTTGIDWFDVLSNRLERCQQHDDPKIGCIRAHGGFEIRGNKVIATVGGRLIIQTVINGSSLIAYDTYLEHNHVMEFAVNSEGTRLYAVAACGYQDGLSAVNLVDGGVPLESESRMPQLPRPAPSPIYKISATCGVRIALSNDQVLVVGQTERSIPDPKNQGALIFIDVNNGRVMRTVTTPSEPVDVITDE